MKELIEEYGATVGFAVLGLLLLRMFYAAARYLDSI